MRVLFAGGINENNIIDPQECKRGENFELQISDTDFKPRLPFDLKGTATNSGTIGGIMQLIERDDTETTLVYEDDGVTPTIYLWNGAATFTSKRTANIAADSKLRSVYWSLDDYIVIVDINKNTPLLKWDGTTVSRLKTGLAAGSAASVTSITRSGSTATVTRTSHGRSVGDLIHIAGANETDYNGEFEILTVPTADTYTYTVPGSPATPATGTITEDRGVDVYAQRAMVHQNRMWFFNITTDDGTGAVENQHVALVSAFEDPTTLDQAQRAGTTGFTGNEAFFLVSPDLKPLNGATIFYKELILSTQDGGIFRLVGFDSTTFEWIDYYAGSAPIGCESLINIGNDVVFMRKGGNIESLIATEASGEVQANDLSRWIPDTVRDLQCSQIVYDQSNQKVLFFVPNKILVLFKDILSTLPVSPWSIYTTQHASLFNTDAAVYLRRPGETTYSIYWGDDSGNIFDLNGQGSGDSGTTDIRTFRESEVNESPEQINFPFTGKVAYHRLGESILNVTIEWSEEYNESTAAVPLKGPLDPTAGNWYNDAAYYNGEFYYNEGFQFTDKLTTKTFSNIGRGSLYIYNFEINDTSTFKINSIDLGI